MLVDGLEEVAHAPASTRSREPSSRPGQLLDQRDRRPPGEDPARLSVDARRRGPAHAAQVEVEHPAEVRGRVVVREPPAQEPVQDHRVEQRLQRVVGVAHRLVEHRRAVVVGGQRRVEVAEPVGLVVDREEPLAAVDVHPQHHVDGAGQVAAQRLVGQRRVGVEGVGVRQHGIAGREVPPQQRREVAEADPRRRVGRVVAAGQRQLEVELAQPVAAGAGRAGCGSPARGPSGLVHTATRASASSSASRSTGHHTRCSAMWASSSARKSGAAGSACSSTAWTSEPNVAPTGRSAIGEGTAAASTSGAVSGLGQDQGVVELRQVLGLRGRLRPGAGVGVGRGRRRGEGRVGGPPPRGVDLAGERPHRQPVRGPLQRGRVGRHQRGGLGAGTDVPAAGVLPVAEDLRDPLLGHQGLLVGHGGSLRAAAEEHAVQRGRRGVALGGGVPGDDLRLGAGHRDVEQAQRLARVLAPVLGHGGAVERARPADVAAPAPVLVVEQRDLRVVADVAVPQGAAGRRRGTPGPCCRGW